MISFRSHFLFIYTIICIHIGWGCESKCPSGTTGMFCHQACPCANGGSCPQKGQKFCTCPKGWMGADCSQPCPEGKQGYNCSQKCLVTIGIKSMSGQLTIIAGCGLFLQGPMVPATLPVADPFAYLVIWEVSALVPVRTDSTVKIVRLLAIAPMASAILSQVCKKNV
jgi:hypothetical protein